MNLESLDRELDLNELPGITLEAKLAYAAATNPNDWLAVGHKRKGAEELAGHIA